MRHNVCAPDMANRYRPAEGGRGTQPGTSRQDAGATFAGEGTAPTRYLGGGDCGGFSAGADFTSVPWKVTFSLKAVSKYW